MLNECIIFGFPGDSDVIEVLNYCVLYAKYYANVGYHHMVVCFSINCMFVVAVRMQGILLWYVLLVWQHSLCTGEGEPIQEPAVLSLSQSFFNVKEGEMFSVRITKIGIAASPVFVVLKVNACNFSLFQHK